MIYLTSVNDNPLRHEKSELDSLIARIAEKDTDALADLYNKTKVSVYGFSLSILKNVHDAEDVMQSCYVNIFSHAVQYKSHGKPMAWILTIVKNLCYQKIRDSQKTTEMPDAIDYESIFSEESDADDRLMIRYCLEMLSDEERQILTLHAVSGFKHREIASLLDIPLGTVLSKYNRAVKKIKEHFKGGENDD